MLITKDELKNSRQLIRVKLSGIESSMLLKSVIIICAVFLVSLFFNIIRLSGKTDWVAGYKLEDYSSWIMAALIAVITFKICRYKQMNQDVDVYPQTCVSRFLSTQALFHIWIVFAALLYMLLYLVEYGTIAAISAFSGNIHLIYKFNIGFVLAGFVVMIIYTSVIAAAASLIAALIRKLAFHAIAVFAFVFGLFIAKAQNPDQLLKTVAGFLIFEQGMLHFIIKGIVLWFAFIILTFITDKKTAYYQDSSRIVNVLVLAITAIGVIILSAAGFIQSAKNYAYDGNVAASILKDSREYGEIVLDASAMPKGSKIDIVARVNNESIQRVFPRPNLKYDKLDLSDFTGDKLVIDYYFPVEIMGYYNLTPFANTRISARLEGTTLYVDYTYDKNVKAVFMPVWTFMRQFNYYKEKDIVPEILNTTRRVEYGEISIK